MSRVTKAQKQHRRERQARRARWIRGCARSMRERRWHRCAGTDESCTWVPQSMRRCFRGIFKGQARRAAARP